ncbi:hypothetical protein MMC25_005572 [Agyrium rufum]|nr:hypothetical protein [Agyrium rufum]
MFRGASVGLIYNRTLILQDGVYDESAAVTLMSTDIDRIATSIRSADDVWAGIIQVSLGMYLLARQLGWVCVMPVLVILASSFGSSAVAKRIGGRQGIWAAAVQQRVAITSSMLGSMRSVKMMGLADMMTTTVQGQRILANIPATFAPIVTFVVFAIQAAVRGSGSLNTNQAFTSLAIISLTSQPAAYLLAAIPVAASALGCLDRIQKFLLATSWEDQRRNAGTKPETSVGPRKGEEGIELQVMPAPVQDINLRAIEVKDATIRPSLTAQPVLRNLNVDIEKGSLTMVLGPVGCGKSTLMRAILGELPCDSGNVSVASKRIAYCSQMPWLLNTSIRHSIYGSRQQEAVDENWYQTVLHACALDEDMLQLPHGDLSVIGSKGLTLSGGQKQRLALARAVYARQEIVLLDDILSALDGKTERAIVDRLLSPQGLFYRLSSTVVLITHSTRHLALATKIIVLGVGGEIVQQGTYNELRKTPGFIQSLQENQQDTTEPKETPISNVRERKELKGPSREQAIDLTRKTGDVAVYSYYMNSIGWPLTIMFVGSCCMFAFAFNFPQIWLKWWTEAGRSQIRKYISVYIILGCVAAFFNAWIMITIFIYVTPKSAARLHYILLCTVMRAPASFFAATDTGETLNRFSQDMTLIDGTLPTSLMVVTITLTEAIVQLALIATGSTYMAISIPFFAFGLYILQKVYLRTSRQLRFMDLEARSPVYSHFLETLEGLSVIRAFGWQGEVGDVNIKRLDASQRPYYLLYCIQRWLNLVLDLMVAAMGVIVIALAVQLRASTNAGLLGIALNNILSFNGTLSQLVNYWTELETSLGAIARLKNFESQIKPEEQPGENVIPPHSWPESGAIEFRNVTAAYNPTALALRNISIDIRPGQKVGICGRTGSGKSSLLSALLRLLDMQSGAIFVDGIDLSTVPREQIRSRMIAIPQDPFIISDTVRLNADPSSIVPDPLIITALTNIGLWQIIESRGGLDANMKEQPLSQGQQQLFCLARAMLRRSKILILDEATSNVDGETDQLMQKIIREEFREHTILTVAHRLETIMDADNVAVLEAGELLEYGPPKELMAKESRFRELHG